ncbi:MAG TPA: choice-of-anchor tandem repeat GloVer-containing protein [Candidatus Methylacidiphilales bacterium]|nr:choice-of-anchor tandem repeat GloVer-containing protein [Candidatus Methylacidiphilales bacterium]
MKTPKILKIASIVAIGFFAPFANAATTTVLHDFTGQDNRSLPYGGLILSGGVLYGTTSGGGTGNTGTVFSINPNGTGKTTLHSFAAFASSGPTNTDGSKPYASMILSGSTLYGTTSAGGSSGNGTVFKVNTDGSGFSTLYTFTGGSDGAVPVSSLVLSGNTLYGTASQGGSGYGTVFKVNTNGSGFTILYSFTDQSDGANPLGGLVLSGSTLYGTTNGDSGSPGTIFKISTSGTGFATVYGFTGGSDGQAPEAALILSGNTLYGTASTEGDEEAEAGTVFKVNTDGSGFTLLYTFLAGDDGADPTSALVLSGSTLYGTTSEAGSGGAGTVFSVSTTGTNFTVLHGLSPASDGVDPNAGLVRSGSALYGAAVSGGSGGNGTLFSLSTSGGSFTNIHNFTAGNGGNSSLAGMILSDSTLYGTTYGSLGPGSFGTIFTINTSGSGYSTLYSFSGGNDGGAPDGELAMSGGTLYGTASQGGSGGSGTVYSIGTSGSGFTVLHSFSPTTNGLTNSDGFDPVAGVVLSGNTLYGAAEYGGTNGNGTIFKVNTDGTGFTILHTFSAFGVGTTTNSDGGFPGGGLIISGGTLYGTTVSGGSGGSGTVFSISTNGTNFDTLYNFTGGDDGAGPYANLTLSGTTLYGTTSFGGANGTGTLFSTSTGGTDFALLHTFGALVSGDNSDGSSLFSGLTLSGSTLYGTAFYGGAYGNGTLFSVSTGGSNFTVWHNFGTLAQPTMTNTYGAHTAADLVFTGGVLYGTATDGGNAGYGTVFSVTP